MTIEENYIIKKVEEYKYAIMYYVYFATCIVVALWLAKPLGVLTSLI